MKKISLVSAVFFLFVAAGCGSSNSSGSSETSGNETYEQENQASGPKLSLKRDYDVYNELSGYTFKSEEGNTISFEGRYPQMTLSMNGQFMDNSFQIVEIGTTSEGYDYGVVLANGPYGPVRFMISELPASTGRPGVFLLDLNSPDDIYYRTR